MTTQLTNFDFNGSGVRVIDMDGEAWFPAKDVCELLALQKPRNAVTHTCHDEDFRHIKQSEIPNAHSMGLSYPNRGMLCVNESGIYALIFSSRKPEARDFKHWVTSTVLPAIRKDGMYVAGEEKVATGELHEDELILKAHEALQRKVDRLSAENAGMRHELEQVTVAEFVALNHVYLTHGQKISLSHAARKAATHSGTPIQKSTRILPGEEGPREVEVNVYPRWALDKAAQQTGIIAAPRPIH